jgi:hypothetical protein
MGRAAPGLLVALVVAVAATVLGRLVPIAASLLAAADRTVVAVDDDFDRAGSAGLAMAEPPGLFVTSFVPLPDRPVPTGYPGG